MNQFLYRTFRNDHEITIGVEFGTKLVVAKGQVIKLQIWDTVLLIGLFG